MLSLTVHKTLSPYRRVIIRAILCHVRNKSTVQCRGVGIFGALGLGDFNDAHDFRSIPNNSFERIKTVSHSAPKRERIKELSFPVVAEAGFGHSVVLSDDGRLFLFGRAFDINSVVRIYGVYKYSSYFARLATKLTIEADRDHKIEVLKAPFLIPGMDRYVFKKVACSGGLTAALSSTGQVFCFGVNKFGQCGTGELRERYWFPSVNVGVPRALDVDVGFQHAICLCIGGDVFTWGKGKNGQMGNGEEQDVNAHSIKVALPASAVAVAAGLNHCAAVDEFGQVYVWGRRMASELLEGSTATCKDQTFPRGIELPNSLKAIEVYCRACNDSLWMIGVDEINQDISPDFLPVYEPLMYQEKSYTEEELNSLPKVPFSAKGCVLKKGYHAVSVISACQQRVYDVTLQRGTARLYEVILEPREEGKIVDYSAGFRHCMMLTNNSE